MVILEKILVKCPRCRKETFYKKKKENPKRTRIYCQYCQYRIEVNKKTIVKLKSKSRQQVKDLDQDNSQPLKIVLKKLDALDKYIIMLTQSQMIPTQKEIAIEISKQLNRNITPQAIQKRLQKLVKENILIKIVGKPNKYILNEHYGKIQEEKKLYVGSHGYKFQCKIIGKYKEYENLRNSQVRRSKMENWFKKYFHENDVLFTLNLHVLEFGLTGAGKTNAQSERNAMTKALEVWYELQKKYDLLLGIPKNIGKIEYHIIPATKKQFEKLQQIRNDASHPGLWEVDDPLLANKIVETLNNQDAINSKMDSLESKFDRFDKAFQTLAINQEKIINSINNLIMVFNKLQSMNINTQEMKNENKKDRLYT